MDREELLRCYATGERDFRGMILQYVDLSGVVLDSVNLSGALFYNVNLRGAWLKHANLSSTEWWDCNLMAQFSFCDFKDAYMECCRFESAFFFDCDWRGVNTKLGDMTNTRFIRVNLEGAKLGASGEEPCEFWDVIRQDGEFVAGFTFNLWQV